MIQKRSLFIYFLFLAIGLSVQAQATQAETPPKSAWRLGGNIGLNFGNNSYFSFGISPNLGYQVSPKLLLGTSLGYAYQKSNYFKNNLFSGGPFLNYSLLQNIFTHAHLEYFNGTRKFYMDGLNEKKVSDEEAALWLGGGYRTNGRVGYQIGLMYNVLYNENKSIFNSPFNTFSGVIIAL
ncbi:Uncharacterised protein [Candidatus Ornithobacterium hominis]|uniref:hypothetical protein n=1 Tax=Candidatus Ornithobacterium hominis TaxID=2497989 RepID=UPI000E5BF16A|nr:hypothetical protein [Candidatus Ornithobacterium hominis]SZD73160.1 Uncharacterised protein [Candidatus Ornithobacterium hominis]